MEATILLRDKSYIIISDFEYLLIDDPFFDNPQKISNDEIKTFTKKDTQDYTLVGDSTVTIQGKDAIFIKFD